MAKLSPNPAKGFAQLPNEKYDAYANRIEVAFEKLISAAATLPEGEVVGQIVSFPVGDGKAHYLVEKDKPLTLAHIPVYDAYQVMGPMIRGLRKEDVAQYAGISRAMATFVARQAASR